MKMKFSFLLYSISGNSLVQSEPPRSPVCPEPLQTESQIAQVFCYSCRLGHRRYPRERQQATTGRPGMVVALVGGSSMGQSPIQSSLQFWTSCPTSLQIQNSKGKFIWCSGISDQEMTSRLIVSWTKKTQLLLTGATATTYEVKIWLKMNCCQQKKTNRVR